MELIGHHAAAVHDVNLDLGAVVSSKRSSNAVLSFPPSSPLSRLFDFEVRYESPIPGMMIPVARAHLMMMAAFAVAFC